MQIKRVCILFVLVPFCFAFSQEKFEKEYRLKPSEVPEKSVKLVKSWGFNKKIKWYAEESNDGKTFEAKTCYKKHNFSIEFDKKGALLDIEKKVKLSELSEEMQQKIKESLSKKFKKYSIKKIQIQYSGEEDKMHTEIFKPEKILSTAHLKYEIIVKGKKENRFKSYELLINNLGDIEKELSIKSFNSINLEF
jgi:hypothetical protein